LVSAAALDAAKTWAGGFTAAFDLHNTQKKGNSIVNLRASALAIATITQQFSTEKHRQQTSAVSIFVTNACTVTFHRFPS